MAKEMQELYVEGLDIPRAQKSSVMLQSPLRQAT